MVDKWDEASRKGNEIPIRPVDEESGPKIVGNLPFGLPAKTVVKFIASPDGPPQIALPPEPSRWWGVVILIVALLVAWLFGLMMQALFHIV